jgi:hypothetical protein
VWPVRDSETAPASLPRGINKKLPDAERKPTAARRKQKKIKENKRKQKKIKKSSLLFGFRTFQWVTVEKLIFNPCSEPLQPKVSPTRTKVGPNPLAHGPHPP